MGILDNGCMPADAGGEAVSKPPLERDAAFWRAKAEFWEHRARDAEALAEALRANIEQHLSDGGPCWCELSPEDRDANIQPHIHDPWCKQSRAALRAWDAARNGDKP